jgi:hypothetical protein
MMTTTTITTNTATLTTITVDRLCLFQPILDLYFFNLSSSAVFLFKIIKL